MHGGCIEGIVQQVKPLIIEPSREAEAELNSFLGDRIYEFSIHASGFRDGRARALLEAAEEESVRRGCTQAVLLTHSFQAPEFYERLGYVRQGTIPNYPQGDAQYVYLKRFVDGRRSATDDAAPWRMEPP